MEGREVLVSPWGWGVVREMRYRGDRGDRDRGSDSNSAVLVVELCDWRLANEQPVLVYCDPDSAVGCVTQSAPAAVGGCVLTAAGVGVVLRYLREAHRVELRMSDDGSVVAVAATEVLRCLPATPGLSVRCEYGKGQCESYDAVRGFFVIKLPWGRVYMHHDAVGLSAPAARAMPSAHVISAKVDTVKKLVRAHVHEDNLAMWGLKMFAESDEKSVDTFVQTMSEKVSREIEDKAGDLKTAVLADVSRVEATPKKVTYLLDQARNNFLGIKDLNGGIQTDVSEIVQRIDATSRGLLACAANPFEGMDNAYMKDLVAKYKDNGEVQKILGELDGAKGLVESRAQIITSVVSKSKTLKTLRSGLSGIHARLAMNTEIGGLLAEKGSDLMNILGSDGALETGSALWEAAGRRFTDKVAAIDLHSRFVQDLDGKVEDILRDVRNGEGGQSKYISLAVLLGMMNEVSARFASVREDAKDGLQDWETRVELVIAEALALALDASPSITGHDLLLQITHPAQAVASLRGRLNSAESRAWQGLDTREHLAGVRADSGEAAAVPSLQNIIDGLRAGSMDVSSLQTYFSNTQAGAIDGDMDGLADQLLKAGDGLVDGLESLRNHQGVRGIISSLKDNDLKLLAASGLQRDQVVQGADSFFDRAELVLKDSKVRDKLIDSTKDQLVDFLLTFVPDMTIPDFEDTQNDLDYAISDLDISAFKVKKEDVQISMNNDPNSFGTDFMKCSAKGISASFEGIRWRFAQQYFPHMSGEGVTAASVEDLSIVLGFKLIRVPKGTIKELDVASDSNAKAARLFGIFPNEAFVASVNDARRTLALADMTTLPKPPVGEDKTALWRGLDVDDEASWEPALVLNPEVSQITMASLKLVTEGSSYSWIYNMLSSTFSGVIKDYVCSSLAAVIHDRLAQLLGRMNKGFSEHVQMLKDMAGLDPSRLPVAGSLDLAALIGPPLVQLTGPQKDYTLKIEGSEDDPLGVVLREEERTATVKRVIIDGCSRSGAVNKAAAAAGCDKFLKGAALRRINGLNVLRDDQRRVAALLSGSRPLYLQVRLSDAGYAMVKAKMRDTAAAEASAGLMQRKQTTRKLKVVKADFVAGPIGLKLKETRSCGGAVIVTGFARDGDALLQAEAMGTLQVGFLMLSVAGAGPADKETVVFGMKFEDVMGLIKVYARPLTMLFVASPDKEVVFSPIPEDLQLARISDHIIVTQASSAVKPGTTILQVNGDKVSKTETAEGTMTRLTTAAATGVAPRVAVRDLDSFMHLIRLRDGLETMHDVTCTGEK